MLMAMISCSLKPLEGPQNNQNKKSVGERLTILTKETAMRWTSAKPDLFKIFFNQADSKLFIY